MSTKVKVTTTWQNMKNFVLDSWLLYKMYLSHFRHCSSIHMTWRSSRSVTFGLPCPDTVSVSQTISINVILEMFNLLTDVFILYNLILTVDSLTCSLYVFTVASLAFRQFVWHWYFILLLSCRLPYQFFLYFIRYRTKNKIIQLMKTWHWNFLVLLMSVCFTRYQFQNYWF